MHKCIEIICIYLQFTYVDTFLKLLYYITYNVLKVWSKNMNLNLVIGKSRSGKTQYCMDNALSGKNESYIIVPEQYSFTAEKKKTTMQSIGSRGDAEVISFGRLASRILVLSDGAAMGHIDNAGKVMILYIILSENQNNLTILKGAKADRSAELLKLIVEFKRYNVSAEALTLLSEQISDEQLKMKLSETAFIYTEFEKALKDRYINSDNNLLHLATIIEKNAFLKECDIYIDAFSSFTEAEILCIRAMLCVCHSVTLTLCADCKQKGRHEFTPTEKTWARLLRLASDVGAKTETVCLTQKEHENTAMRHLEVEFFNYPAKIFKDETSAIETFIAANPYTEITHTAAAILRLVQNEGYLYRDIGIIYSDADLYSKYIKNVFHSFNIPVFPDEKKGLPNHPVVIFILSALEIVTDGFSYEPVFRLAKSGFARIPRELVDILENYILATGLKGNIWRDSEKWSIRAEIFTENSELTDEEKANLLVVNRARDIIAKPIITLADNLKNGKTIKEKCIALYEYIILMKLPSRLDAMSLLLSKKGDAYKGTEYKTIYGKIIDAMDELVDSAGDKEITVKAFSELLVTGLSQYETGVIPALCDGVLSGDIARMRGYDVRAVFILGANDPTFPIIPSPNGFLSDSDRLAMKKEGIEIAPDAKTNSLEGEHLLYKAFTCASEKLFISFPCSDFMGSALRPSMAVLRVQEIFPNAKIHDNIMGELTEDILASPFSASQSLALHMGSESMTPLYKEIKSALEKMPNYSDKILAITEYINYKNSAKDLSPQNISTLLGKTLYTAVSRLESFSACPFLYFMRYTLRAKERHLLSLGAADAGNFLHNFIDEFSKGLQPNNKTWHTVDEAYIDSEIEKIMIVMDRRLNKYFISESTRTANIFVRLCNAIKLCLSVISEHMKRGVFIPMGYEMSFGENGDFRPMEITLPSGEKVVLTGRIDRADKYENSQGETFVRIIDYKSGSKSFDLSEVFYGINLQLAVYLTAICESSNYQPAGILYFKLDDPIIKTIPGIDADIIYNEKIKHLKLSGLIVDTLEVLEASDKTGVFSDFLPVRKLKSGEFKGDIASNSSFSDLQRHVKETVSHLATEILSGKTEISPYKIKNTTPCQWCPYKSACRFDTAIGCSYRKLNPLKKDDVFIEIGGDTNEL